MNAQARGARAAKLYKKTKSKLIALDQFCVQKARKHKLPTWAGHLPVITLTGGLVAAMIFGSLLFVGLSLCVFALILLSPVISKNLDFAPSHKASYERFSWEKNNYEKFSWEQEMYEREND
ncbi:hypothetical protein LHT88_003641 [Salmonella enterica]|nr:hypothetical protein [Salmonella enterica]